MNNSQNNFKDFRQTPFDTKAKTLILKDGPGQNNRLFYHKTFLWESKTDIIEPIVTELGKPW